MLKKISFWPSILFLICIQLVSCKIIGTVQIEVIKPADVILPKQVSSLMVLNNYRISANDSFSNEVQKAYYLLDTLSSNKIISQVIYYLNESPRIDSCLSIPMVFYKPAKDIMKPMDWKQINLISEKYQVDAVLSLEGLGIIDSMARITQFDGYIYSSYTLPILYINSIWRLYIPGTEEQVEKWIQRDTLFVTAFSTINEFRDEIKTDNGRNWLSDEIAVQVSPNVSNKLAPYWIPVKRDFFYNQQPEMQQAAIFAFHNEWLKAAAIWQKLSTNKDSWISGAACHNMALVCEVQGKLALAIIWENKAIVKLNNPVTNNYLKILEYRLKEEELLNKQFGVINE